MIAFGIAFATLDLIEKDYIVVPAFALLLVYGGRFLASVFLIDSVAFLTFDFFLNCTFT
jgi:hypothetical protein